MTEGIYDAMADVAAAGIGIAQSGLEGVASGVAEAVAQPIKYTAQAVDFKPRNAAIAALAAAAIGTVVAVHSGPAAVVAAVDLALQAAADLGSGVDLGLEKVLSQEL
ncbi:hypothetical protein OG216_38225 [Streptomycetaceae bacterium NBC_01309]